jgi:hypothetical protein
LQHVAEKTKDFPYRVEAPPQPLYLSQQPAGCQMLVKSGSGSFSMVGGFVMSAPQHHSQRPQQTTGFALLWNQLLKRFR